MEDLGRVELVNQPLRSTICGQCCVAMLTGATLRRVINLVGHEHGTRTKELVRVIRRLGYDCDDRLRAPRDLAKELADKPRALVKLTFDTRSTWHWLAWADGKVYDPSLVEAWSLEAYLQITSRPTSYLEIRSGTGWSPLQPIKG